MIAKLFFLFALLVGLATIVATVADLWPAGMTLP